MTVVTQTPSVQKHYYHWVNFFSLSFSVTLHTKLELEHGGDALAWSCNRNHGNGKKHCSDFLPCFVEPFVHGTSIAAINSIPLIYRRKLAWNAT